MRAFDAPLDGPAEGHWAAAYVGRPWIAGTGECWHRAAEVWREVFGWDVPIDVAGGRSPRAAARLLGGEPERLRWAPILAAEARDGDGVLMARHRPCHVGLVAAGGVLHCVEGAGTIWTPVPRLADLGWRVEGLYRRLP